MANIMNQKTKYLISKWNKRIQMVERAKGEALSYEKRAVLANTLENTADSIRMMEAVNPSAIGQYKRYALDENVGTYSNMCAYPIELLKHPKANYTTA